MCYARPPYVPCDTPFLPSLSCTLLESKSVPSASAHFDEETTVSFNPPSGPRSLPNQAPATRLADSLFNPSTHRQPALCRRPKRTRKKCSSNRACCFSTAASVVRRARTRRRCENSRWDWPRCQDGCRQTKWRLSRASPQVAYVFPLVPTPSLHVHRTDCLPLLRRRPCYVASGEHGPRIRRHAQGLPLAPRRRLLQPAAHRRHFAPHRLRVPREYQQHPRRRRPVGRRRLAVCRLLRHPAAQRNGGHPGLGPAAHKGVLPRYDSNTRGQLPSRSPR